MPVTYKICAICWQNFGQQEVLAGKFGGYHSSDFLLSGVLVPLTGPNWFGILLFFEHS